MKCTHCSVNITDKLRPGFKCTNCLKWIHETCARLPVGVTLWTCGSCKISSRRSGGPSGILGRSSLSIPRRDSTGTSRPVSHPLNQNTTNTFTEQKLETLVKEIEILKSINTEVLDSLAKLSDMTKLLSEFRDENRVLRQANERLKAENNQIKLTLHVAESKQYTNTSELVSSVVSRDSYEPDQTESVLETVTDDRTTSEEPTRNGLSSAISAVSSLKWLKVSNLAPTTTCEAVRKHVASSVNVDRSQISCSLLTPKSIVNPFFTSFKVGVPIQVFETAFCKDIWPVHTEICAFLGPSKTNFLQARPRGSLS